MPAGLPEIAGKFVGCDLQGNSGNAWTGAFTQEGVVPSGCAVGGVSVEAPSGFSASKYNTTYGSSETVMPESVDLTMGLYLGRPA